MAKAKLVPVRALKQTWDGIRVINPGEELEIEEPFSEDTYERLDGKKTRTKADTTESEAV